MTPEDFYKALQEEGFNLSQQQKDQFQRYFELLVEWNEKINLTAITDKNDVYLKHFYDSLAPVLQGHIKNQDIRLLDIGAGAGFPSLPMKILCPKLEVTIIDSLNKRINFLNLLADELQLSGVHFYHGRAEDFGQDKAFRAQFDVVTARAVARLQIVQAANLFRASVIDVSPESVVIEATGSAEKIHALLDVLEPYGIREIVRAGTIALSRGPRAMSERI